MLGYLTVCGRVCDRSRTDVARTSSLACESNHSLVILDRIPGHHFALYMKRYRTTGRVIYPPLWSSYTGRCPVRFPSHCVVLDLAVRYILISSLLGLFVGCLTSQQQASVSQGRICTVSFTCCHTEIEVSDQIFYLTQSQYTDTGPTSPSADPITPGAWQGSHWSANFWVTAGVVSGIRTWGLPLSRRTP